VKRLEGADVNRNRFVMGMLALVTCCVVALQPGAALATCSIVCPGGTAYDASTAQCSATAAPCLSGYAYDASTNRCVVSAPATTSSATCPHGSGFSPLFGKCEAPNLGPCPAGFVYASYANRCESAATFTPAASCPDGYAYDSVANRCAGPAKAVGLLRAGLHVGSRAPGLQLG
jgi:hypothetical protein